jgi:sporulation protein YlmC with PRC-barrel domain
MYLKLVAVTALGALLSTVAYGEDQNASSKGEWQASKLIHLNVYNGQNEKIGDIKELMVDKSGKVQDVVIGAGGFLGAGEHDVAVKFDQLKWSDQPVSSSSSNKPGSATTGSTASSDSKSGKNYPDHAVLSMNKDQLKAMPQYNYNK